MIRKFADNKVRRPMTLVEGTMAPWRKRIARLAAKSTSPLLALFASIWTSAARAADLPPSAVTSSPSGVTGCEAAFQSLQLEYDKLRMDALIKEMGIRLSIFQDQRIVNFAILVSVTIIVLFGAAFAIQMLRSSVLLGKGQPVSDLEITLQRVRLSSFQTASLVGLLLFAMTLTFFYLYMKIITSVHELAVTGVAESAAGVGPPPSGYAPPKISPTNP